MKKILALAKAYYPHLGGVETIVRSIAEHTIERGFRTTVLCFGEGPKDEFLLGVRIRRIDPAVSIGSAPLSFSYFQAFRELSADADLVHIHSPNPAGEIAWLSAPRSLRNSLPSLCTYQGDPVRPRLLVPAYLTLLRTFLARCSLVAVSSPSLKISSRALGKIRERCRIIPLGVKAERFERSGGILENAFAAELKRPLGLFVGRMVYYKGVDVLLRAIALVPDITLLLVGEGPLRSSLEHLADNLGISARVRFLMPVDYDSYPDLFRSADFFVLPSVSQSEAFGLSLVEAMASGLPVISTDLGTGTSYVNLHGETGLVVAPGDPLALAEAMQLLCGDPQLASEMGERAALRARLFFEEDRMVEEYASIYYELLGIEKNNKKPLNKIELPLKVLDAIERHEEETL